MGSQLGQFGGQYNAMSSLSGLAVGATAGQPSATFGQQNKSKQASELNNGLPDQSSSAVEHKDQGANNLIASEIKDLIGENQMEKKKYKDRSIFTIFFLIIFFCSWMFIIFILLHSFFHWKHRENRWMHIFNFAYFFVHVQYRVHLNFF